jgi:hypothetical protein
VPLLLRRLKKYGRWIEPCPWLPQGEAPSHVMTLELENKNNKLSVWEIEDDESNLNDVIVALVSMLDVVDTFDCMLVDKTCVADQGLTLVPTRADTPHRGANKWHLDITELTVSGLARLTRLLYLQGSHKRRDGIDVRSLMLEAISAGKISPDKLQEPMRKSLGLMS